MIKIQPHSLLSIIFLITSWFTVYSQDTTSNDYFFDDGGISEAQFILKANAFSLINGDASVSLETRLSIKVSIEASIGYQLPFYAIELPAVLTDEFDYDTFDPKSGYSWSIQPKYYFSGNYPQAGYISLLLRKRNYTLQNYTQTHTDFALVTGVQFSLSSRILLDFNYGIGARIIKTTPENIQLKNLALSLPVALKIGYIL